MQSLAVSVLCFASLFATAAFGQASSLEPIHAAAGTVLTFYLQTRLNPAGRDPLDALREGTILRVKLLNSIDSRLNHDGDVFHGDVVSPLVSGNEVVIQSGAYARGLFTLLRSRNHPQGFRYELLITGLTDRGKSYALTASLDPSLRRRESFQRNLKAGGEANSSLN